MKRIFLALVLLSSLCVSAESAIIYVDKDNSCPGAGTTDNPYCSIQNAFDRNLKRGDSIRIRDAATAYDQNALLNNKSGSSGNPIIIEPDTGNNPTIRYSGNGSQNAAIEIRDSSYVIVRNLTFDGTGIAPSQSAIRVQASTHDISGNEVYGNTFLNWSGSEAQDVHNISVVLITSTGLRGGSVPRGTLVHDNTFTNCRHVAIGLPGAQNPEVYNNTVTGLKSGHNFGSGTRTSIEATAITSGSWGGAAAPANNSQGANIHDNSLHDFEPYPSNGLPNKATAAYHVISGFHADVNADNGQLVRNLIYNINQGIRDGAGVGIFIESRCDGWVVKENRIYHMGNAGILNGRSGTGDANNNQFINNVVDDAGYGLWAQRGFNLTIKNNIFSRCSILAIFIDAIAASEAPHTIDYNDYYSTDSNRIGKWNASCTDGMNCTFDAWKTTIQAVTGQSADDTHAISTDPLFVSATTGSEDYHLKTSPASPCINAGLNGVHIGAFPKDAPSRP
jgi:parallel beta helix pectate lyase-like protein